MPQWLTLNASIHAEAGCEQFRGYGFAGRDNVALVAAAEIPQLLPWYVVVFIFNEKLDRYHLAVLLSLSPGKNIFVAEDYQWQAPYVPSHYRGYPFGLDAHGQLRVDTDSGLFSDPAGLGATPLYRDGELTDLPRRVHGFHKERQQALGTTQVLVDQLQTADLLQPWPIRWQHEDQAHVVKGYCGVDEDRLRQLPADTYVALGRSGALGLAYAQLFSRPRVADLQLRHRKSGVTGVVVPEPHLRAIQTTGALDALFNEDDDELSF